MRKKKQYTEKRLYLFTNESRDMKRCTVRGHYAKTYSPNLEMKIKNKKHFKVGCSFVFFYILLFFFIANLDKTRPLRTYQEKIYGYSLDYKNLLHIVYMLLRI